MTLPTLKIDAGVYLLQELAGFNLKYATPQGNPTETRLLLIGSLGAHAAKHPFPGVVALALQMLAEWFRSSTALLRAGVLETLERVLAPHVAQLGRAAGALDMHASQRVLQQAETAVQHVLHVFTTNDTLARCQALRFLGLLAPLVGDRADILHTLIERLDVRIHPESEISAAVDALQRIAARRSRSFCESALPAVARAIDAALEQTRLLVGNLVKALPSLHVSQRSGVEIRRILARVASKGWVQEHEDLLSVLILVGARVASESSASDATAEALRLIDQLEKSAGAAPRVELAALRGIALLKNSGRTLGPDVFARLGALVDAKAPFCASPRHWHAAAVALERMIALENLASQTAVLLSTFCVHWIQLVRPEPARASARLLQRLRDTKAIKVAQTALEERLQAVCNSPLDDAAVAVELLGRLALLVSQEAFHESVVALAAHSVSRPRISRKLLQILCGSSVVLPPVKCQQLCERFAAAASTDDSTDLVANAFLCAGLQCRNGLAKSPQFLHLIDQLAMRATRDPWSACCLVHDLLVSGAATPASRLVAELQRLRLAALAGRHVQTLSALCDAVASPFASLAAASAFERASLLHTGQVLLSKVAPAAFKCQTHYLLARVALAEAASCRYDTDVSPLVAEALLRLCLVVAHAQSAQRHDEAHLVALLRYALALNPNGSRDFYLLERRLPRSIVKIMSLPALQVPDATLMLPRLLFVHRDELQLEWRASPDWTSASGAVRLTAVERTVVSVEGHIVAKSEKALLGIREALVAIVWRPAAEKTLDDDLESTVVALEAFRGRGAVAVDGCAVARAAVHDGRFLALVLLDVKQLSRSSGPGRLVIHVGVRDSSGRAWFLGPSRSAPVEILL